MEAKIPLGASQDAEKWSQNFSGGPPAKTGEFFLGPGGLQERSGVDFYSVLAAPWGPGGAQGVPGGSGSSFLIILEVILASFWHCFGHLGSRFGLRGGTSGGRQAAPQAAKAISKAAHLQSLD